MAETAKTDKPDRNDVIDHLLRVQDVIDELVNLKKLYRGNDLARLKVAIDDLQTGKESLDDFRDGGA